MEMIIRVLINNFVFEHGIACRQQRLKLWWVYWRACGNIAVLILTDTITKSVCVVFFRRMNVRALHLSDLETKVAVLHLR